MDTTSVYKVWIELESQGVDAEGLDDSDKGWLEPVVVIASDDDSAAAAALEQTRERWADHFTVEPKLTVTSVTQRVDR